MLRELCNRLREMGLEEREATAEARYMLTFLLKVPLSELYLWGNELLSAECEQKLQEILQRRKKGEPLAYILGERYFMGLPFKVKPGILIPRQETELLCEQAIETIQKEHLERVLDLCTGSGCIGLAVAKHAENCRVVLGDLSEDALRICRQNARQNGLATRTTILTVDALQPPTHFLGDFNVIVCNPPYIRSGDIPGLDVSVRDYEPLLALDGGADGLAFYRYLAQHWKLALRRQGTLLFEVGYDQAEDVSDLLAQYGYRNITQHKDYNGILRGVEATL